MMQSWVFANGKRIMFPTGSSEAEVLGWHCVKHDIYVSDSIYSDTVEWLNDNIEDRAYYLGAWNVYFYREKDATMFTLKWL